MKVWCLIAFALGIVLAQHEHRLEWAAYTSASVQQCTKGPKG